MSEREGRPIVWLHEASAATLSSPAQRPRISPGPPSTVFPSFPASSSPPSPPPAGSSPRHSDRRCWPLSGSCGATGPARASSATHCVLGRRGRLAGGRLAADLELFGTVPPAGRTGRWFRPLAGARRVSVAWRVGRLRAVLPDRAAEITAQADADLSAVGPLSELGDAELIDLLTQLQQELVGRVAEATALPALDRRVAQRLAVMAPPSGGLLSDPAGPAPVAAPNGAGRRGAALIRTGLAQLTLMVLGWMGGNALVEAAQSRPDPADRPARTTIDLSIAYRGSAAPPPTATAEALWIACRSTLGSLPVTAEVLARGASGATLVLQPGLGPLGVRRLTGCLADLRLDLVQADVLRAASDLS